MRLSQLATVDEVIARHRTDPEFAQVWDRAAFARDVAIRIIAWRAEHDMTQTELARAVGMHQPVIARLENGEHPPSLATLAKLSAGTGIEFHLDITAGNIALTA